MAGVKSAHNAPQELVVVPLHAAQGHVAGWDVEPRSDVRQLCALQLVHRACVPRAHGVGSCAIALVYPVPDRLHGQVPPDFREHMQTLRGNVEVDDGRLHAIGEIGAMVDVARQVQPHSFVDLHAERNRRPACNDVMLRVEVGRVGFELSEPPPPAGGE